MPPSLLAALGQGFRATAREPWLVPVGAFVAGLRRAATWPAWAVLGALLLRAVLGATLERPFDPSAPARGAFAALGSPRLVALIVGLWGAGVLVGAALRVAWIAGALPTLGVALSGAPREPRFAAGIAYTFPRVLAAATLALAAEVAGALFGLGLALAALRVAVRAGGSVLLAAACASALVIALAVPIAAGALADAAVARAALRGEGPGEAFAAAVRRFLARPGTFVLGALAFSLAGALAPLSVEGVSSLAMGFAQGVDPALLLGPNLLFAAVALGIAAALDLWWLGTVSALACGRDRG